MHKKIVFYFSQHLVSCSNPMQQNNSSGSPDFLRTVTTIAKRPIFVGTYVKPLEGTTIGVLFSSVARDPVLSILCNTLKWKN